MYPNAGKSIKKCVSIVVKIYYVLAGILTAFVLIGGVISGSATVFLSSLLIAAITFALLCLAVWLWGLFVYAYGEMAERLISIDEKMDRLIPNNANTEQGTAPNFFYDVNAPSAVYCESCGARNNPNARYCAACCAQLRHIVPAAKPSDGSWRCSCGLVNAKYVSTCACGINRRELKQ